MVILRFIHERKILGASLSQFLKQVNSEENEQGQSAIELLRQLTDSEAKFITTSLCRRLKSRNAQIREEAIKGLRHISIKQTAILPLMLVCLRDSNVTVQQTAIEMIGCWGKDAAEAVPALIDLLRQNKQLAVQLTEALGQIGEPASGAVPVLIEQLSALNSPLRRATQNALLEIGRSSQTAVCQLATRLQITDSPEWYDIVKIIEAIDGQVESVIVELLKCAVCTDRKVRRRAIDVLSKCNPRLEKRQLPKECIIELKKCLNDPEVRKAAAYCLKMAGEQSTHDISGLLRFLDDIDPNVRRSIIQVLAKTTTHVDEIVQIFVERLLACDNQDGIEICNALNRIDKTWFTSSLLLPMASRILDSVKNRTPNAGIMEARLFMLSSIGSQAEKAVHDVIDCLSESPSVTLAAVAALERMGKPAADAIPFLVELVASEDADISKSAAVALEVINPEWSTLPEAVDFVPDMIQHLSASYFEASPSAKKRYYTQKLGAIWVLGKIGPAAKDAIPHLAILLGNEQTSVTENAAWALRSIDLRWQRAENAKEAIPVLLKQRISHDLQKRTSANAALEEISPDWNECPQAIKVLPFLIKTIEDEVKNTQCYEIDSLVPVLEVVGKLGERAGGVAPALIKLCSVENKLGESRFISKFKAKELVATALGKIGTASAEAVPILTSWLNLHCIYREIGGDNRNWWKREGLHSLSAADAAIVIQALDRIGVCSDEVVRVLVQQLVSEQVEVQEFAGKVLNRLAPEWTTSQGARLAIPFLAKSLFVINRVPRSKKYDGTEICDRHTFLSAVRTLAQIDERFEVCEEAKHPLEYWFYRKYIRDILAKSSDAEERDVYRFMHEVSKTWGCMNGYGERSYKA